MNAPHAAATIYPALVADLERAGSLTVSSSGGWLDHANYFLNEDLFTALDRLSPPGYYFGSHPGDGACYGWFRGDDDEEA